jgi:hypothetical protein
MKSVCGGENQNNTIYTLKMVQYSLDTFLPDCVIQAGTY